MGNSESTQGLLSSAQGYQIARVSNNSPAHTAGLVPFFDFITAVDDLALDDENRSFFFDYIKKNLGKRVKLSVFNLRIQAMRDVVVVPNNEWGGKGVLGCNVAWETAEHAMENTWRIVQVDEDSAAGRVGSSGDANAAAAAAGGGSFGGLMAQRDHIIGAQTLAHNADSISLFKDNNDFHQRVEAWREYVQTHSFSGGNQPGILLLIYDAVDNAVKEIFMNSFRQRDGEWDLSLGLDVANGFLHQIPSLSARDGGSLPMIKRFVVINDVTSSANTTPALAAPAAPAAAAAPTVPAPTGAAAPAQPLENGQFASPFVPPAAAPAEPAVVPSPAAAAPSPTAASPDTVASPTPPSTSSVPPVPPQLHR